jgi:hypothetical protein
MTSRIIAFGALALACIVAAGGGAYLAVRQSERASQPAQAVNEPVGTPAPVANPAAPAGLVTTPPAEGEIAAAPVASSAAAPPAEAAPGASKQPRVARPTERATRRSAPKVTEDPDQQAADQPDAKGAPQANNPVDPSGQPQAAQQPQSVTQPAAEPQREWVEVTVPSESVLGLQVQTAISSDTARVEDRVEARVTRDIRVNDRVAIPAGTQALGSVVQVERGGKLKDRAQIAIRFNTLVLPDGNRLSIVAEAVHREGPSPANKSAAKIGGATVGGAILGAILGGGKGAAIGGAIGAGGGTAATMAGDREPATLPAGSIVNVRLMSPVTVTLER